MPLPQLGPTGSTGPPFIPNSWGKPANEESSSVVGFLVRPLVGINIAFASPAMTDQPLWIRIDDPGS